MYQRLWEEVVQRKKRNSVITTYIERHSPSKPRDLELESMRTLYGHPMDDTQEIPSSSLYHLINRSHEERNKFLSLSSHHYRDRTSLQIDATRIPSSNKIFMHEQASTDDSYILTKVKRSRDMGTQAPDAIVKRRKL